ncbi:hypothetical protein Cfor_05282 [Coptotermes formosanus]|jgi:hypothetical protein|uniref:Uncharacterized protein n=1 Tax=Coptotermes formosanus TaxID=36987 RepID=A0A6L2PWC2_COPFO|nr:hypothetical protein Cfor_05282 [Coptotermes formosanus]
MNAVFIVSEPRPTARLVAADVSTHRALEWLLRKRLDDWGWGSETPRALLAVQLGNTSTWFGGHNLESLLSGKQMELEIMLQLWRYFSTISFCKLFQYLLIIAYFRDCM